MYPLPVNPAFHLVPFGAFKAQREERIASVIRLTCVIDNKCLPQSNLVCEHGLCFRIDSDHGTVFFDTGATTTALAHNLDRLPPAQGPVSGVVLSHAHYDHTGGLALLVSRFPGIPLFASPHIFERRLSGSGDALRDIGLPTTRAMLQRSASLQLDDRPRMVLPGVWTTGEIPNRSEPEGRSPHHFVVEDGTALADPYRDDMSLVLHVTGGLVVVLGCCHAGLLNTLAHVSDHFAGPILAAVGGTHLIEAVKDYLQHVVEILRHRYGGPKLYVNHCTGDSATAAFVNAFPGSAGPCPAGTVLHFS